MLLAENVMFAFSLVDGHTVTITVTEGGPVDYSESMAGPFGEVAGTIAEGEAVDFTQPHTLRAQGDATLDLAYTGPPVTEVAEADTPSVEE